MLLPILSTFLSTGISNHSVTFCPYRDSSLALRMTRRQEGACYFHTKNTAPKGGAFLFLLERISGGEGIGSAVANVVMVVGNIFVVVFSVEEVIHSKLESEILIELVVGREVHEEIGIAGLEMSAFFACFGPVGNEHAVQVHSPGILAVGSAQMEQMAGNVIVLFPFNLPCLPGVIDVGRPCVAMMLGQGNFKAMGLGVSLILVLSTFWC